MMNDNSKMPFGIHKGKAMANVPGGYLLYLWETFTWGPRHADLKDYIERNLDVLKKEK